MAKYFVFVKINGDHQPAVKNRFGIRGYPTIKFMHPDETVFDEMVGFRPAPAFVDGCKSAARKGGFKVD